MNDIKIENTRATYKEIIYDGIKDIIEINKQIQDLIKSRDIMILKTKDRIIAPDGWLKNSTFSSENKCIIVECYKNITIEKPPILPTQELKEPDKFDKLNTMLRYIDAKTLFNSGILTKEEKRALLNLD